MTILVAGRGEAHERQRDRFESTPALSAIRYADPAAWATATAVAIAIAPARERVSAEHDRTGVIAVSDDGPVEAMAAMCEASRAGSSSPLRYPASNAGSLAGLTSIAFSLRGPTLMLTLPPDRGVPVALLLAEAWVRRGVVSFVAVAACRVEGQRPRARAVLLGAEGEPLDASWLVGA